MPNKIKVGHNVLSKNQRRMDRKGGKFSFKWIGSFTVHSISNKTLCFLINKDGTLINQMQGFLFEDILQQKHVLYCHRPA